MTFDEVNPIPIVGVAPDSDPLTCLAVNTDWVPILVGMVEKADWAGWWEGTDEEIRAALSHVNQLACMMIGGSCMSAQVCTIVERSAVAGGASAVGWQTRNLSSIEGSPDWVSLNGSGPYFTPDAGDYYIEVSAPMYRTGNSIIRLYSPVTPFIILEGETGSNGSTSPVSSRLSLAGFFTAVGGVDYYIRQYATLVKTVNGLGVAPAAGVTGVHTRVTLWRLSA